MFLYIVDVCRGGGYCGRDICHGGGGYRGCDVCHGGGGWVGLQVFTNMAAVMESLLPNRAASGCKRNTWASLCVSWAVVVNVVAMVAVVANVVVVMMVIVVVLVEVLVVVA